MDSVKSTSFRDITLVIPCNHSKEELLDVLRAVLRATLLPKEILVIMSSVEGNPQSTNRFVKFKIDNLNELRIPSNLSIKYCYLPVAFPGNARNIGLVNSSFDVIAFLDVKTIPTQNWLEDAFNTLESLKVDGVWGARKYVATTMLGGLMRDAIYGRHPVRSLTGTVCRKNVFDVTGRMIEWSPAGEDGDWIHRVEAHKLTFISSNKANHIYQGLDNKTFLFFVKKWWLYYHYSRLLPVNHRDRFLSFALFYITLIFIAFNWNFKISVALLGSPFVIPHVTTGLVIAGPMLYLIIRAFYLPLRRGTPFFRLFPTRFIFIFMVASVLDLVKMFALLTPVGLIDNPESRKSQRNRFS